MGMNHPGAQNPQNGVGPKLIRLPERQEVFGVGMDGDLNIHQTKGTDRSSVQTLIPSQRSHLCARLQSRRSVRASGRRLTDDRA
jgi:hypothetical protein